MAAAIYAERALLKTVVLEKTGVSGGQIINSLELDNYPGLPGISGYEWGVNVRAHAEKTGARFVTDEVTEILDLGERKEVVGKKERYLTKAVFVATGANARLLGVPGERELTGKGVSYCATCDGAFFKNQTVAVVGGGDIALDDALYLARICKKVWLIHRRDALRGVRILQEKVFNTPNIEILWDSTVSRVNGTDEVTSIDIRNVKTAETTTLSVQGLFLAVGMIPNTDGIAGLPALDAAGYIQAGEDCVTEIPGIFAGGDVRVKKLRQVSTAVADGANAVTSVSEYLLTLS
jgi:thioredoxin reductase (NADPH)